MYWEVSEQFRTSNNKTVQSDVPGHSKIVESVEAVDLEVIIDPKDKAELGDNTRVTDVK